MSARASKKSDGIYSDDLLMIEGRSGRTYLFVLLDQDTVLPVSPGICVLTRSAPWQAGLMRHAVLQIEDVTDLSALSADHPIHARAKLLGADCVGVYPVADAVRRSRMKADLEVVGL